MSTRPKYLSWYGDGGPPFETVSAFLGDEASAEDVEVLRAELDAIARRSAEREARATAGTDFVAWLREWRRPTRVRCDRRPASRRVVALRARRSTTRTTSSSSNDPPQHGDDEPPRLPSHDLAEVARDTHTDAREAVA